MPTSPSQSIFATTSWTLISDATSEDPTMALEALCQAYWFPLYAYLRRTGETKENAEDLTQGFFAHLLGRSDLSTLDRAKGKFRSFLLASLKNYISNDRDKKRTLKRGGKSPHLSLDWTSADEKFQLTDSTSTSPDAAFDREWATTLLENVLLHLETEYTQADRLQDFKNLKPYLTTDREELPYEQTAEKLGIKPTALRVAVHRLRKRYRNLLKSEVAKTIAHTDDIQNELTTLLTAFSK